MHLFVVTHKDVNNIPADRTLIGVGSNRNLHGMDYFDNVGENIENKNNSYCELTALYWIWKNIDDDYIGLEHYRRFFCNKNLLVAKPLTNKRIKKIFDKHDIILPKKGKWTKTIKEYYAENHFGEDLDICRNIIERQFPDYINDFDAIINGHEASLFNMFVMPKTYVDEYCSWLFSILFEAEKMIDYSERDLYQQRVFGFLSERLFNVWLHHHNFKIYYAPVYNINDKPIVLKISNKIKKLRKTNG